ncbi:hypothetical protein [Lysobacter claricitrinus]|uniref:hypothetical protein n=1 Tax=Lysobacter claricitrinus TaxID=3367728 RepID=UPI0037DBD536
MVTSNDEAENLSFEWLYERVSSYVAQTTTQGPSTLEKWASGIAFVAAGVGLLVAALSPSVIAPSAALRTMKYALAAELLGFVVAVARMLWREVPRWCQLRANHALDMDREFGLWCVLVAEVRRFPRAQREQMLAFARRLREGMTYRMGLALGGVERLGVFPVLVALYLQFRKKWGQVPFPPGRSIPWVM